jgi:hypothetical protein
MKIGYQRIVGSCVALFPTLSGPVENDGVEVDRDRAGVDAAIR